MRVAGSTVLVARATVQEEVTLGALVTVWTVATWWAGWAARWDVACAIVTLIKEAAAVVLTLEPVVGHRSH